MIASYMDTLVYFHPGINAQLRGGDTEYNQIIWNDPSEAIAQSILDPEQITLSKIFTKQEIEQYVEDRIANDGIYFNSHHFSTHTEEVEFLVQFMTANSLGLTLNTLNGLSNSDNDLVSMTLQEMKDLFEALTNYHIALQNWKFDCFANVEALTTLEDIGNYEYQSSVPTNDYN